MSDRPDRDRGSREREKQATPKPDRIDLAEWIEDKFHDEEFPRYLQLKVAVGMHGYREANVHQEEFKPNAKMPQRADFATIANKMLTIAQTTVNEIGKQQLFMVLAINPTKGSQPYGLFHFRMRPIVQPGSLANGPQSQEVDADSEMLPDGVHRDQLLRHYLDHTKQSDENSRWMMDNLHRATGDVMKMQQTIIQQQQDHIRFLEAQRLEAFKAVEASLSQKDERDMKRQAHEFKLGLMQHGFQFVKQMVPVVVKTLDKNKNGETPQLPANGSNGAAVSAPPQISDSPESVAIREFVNGLTQEQKVALFGHVDGRTGVHVPNGVFTGAQVQLIGNIAELRTAPDAIDALLDDGNPLKLTDEQMQKAQEIVPMDQLSPLYFIFLERQKSKFEAGAQAGAQSVQQETSP